MTPDEVVKVLEDLLARKQALLSSYLPPNKSIARKKDLLAIGKRILKKKTQ